MSAQAVTVDRLNVHFKSHDDPRTAKVAVNDCTFSIPAGQSLALIGESGSGKTTVGRYLVGLQKATSGTGHVGTIPVDYSSKKNRTELRRRVQIVFQDPRGSLDRRFTAIQSVMEPLVAAGYSTKEARVRAAECLELVGIGSEELHSRVPAKLSGGQCQRVGIARALATRPSVLICDEPTSALDSLVQADVLRLLQRIRSEIAVTMLFITHDLRVASAMCDEIAVMKDGSIVETATPQALFEAPTHEFTQKLVAATRYERGSDGAGAA